MIVIRKLYPSRWSIVYFKFSVINVGKEWYLHVLHHSQNDSLEFTAIHFQHSDDSSD